MSSRRTVILLVAIVVGALAAFLLFSYVQGIEDDVYEGATRVEVYQAQDLIARGTVGADALNEGLIAQKGIPQEFKPLTAIDSTEEIVAKVALFDISPGTVIVQDMFVDPATTQISFRQRLKNRNHVAITINVDPTRAVGGFLVAGDEVNMLVFEERGEVDEEAVAPEGGEAVAPGEPAGAAGSPALLTQAARYLYQDVQIIAVGENVLLEPGESVEADPSGGSQSNLITLNVPPKAAQWIASFDNDFYLSLTPEDYEPKAIEPLPEVVETLPGEDPNLLTPYCGPEGEFNAPTPCPPPAEGGE